MLFRSIPFKPLVSEWHTNFDAIVGHRAIKLYITKFPGDLDVPEGILAPYTAYTNRRSWVKLSEALLSFEAAGQDLLDFKGDTTNDQPAESFLTKLAASYIGETVAMNFVNFIKKDYKVHTPEDILNKWTAEMETELSAAPATEVGFYSKILVQHIAKHGLKTKQHANLTRFFFCIPKESAAGFYRSFIEQASKACVDWYTGDERIAPYVMNDLLKSK